MNAGDGDGRSGSALPAAVAAGLLGGARPASLDGLLTAGSGFRSAGGQGRPAGAGRRRAAGGAGRALGGAVFAGLRLALAPGCGRWPPASGRPWRRRCAAGRPAGVYDALAMFGGTRAARIPGRRADLLGAGAGRRWRWPAWLARAIVPAAGAARPGARGPAAGLSGPRSLAAVAAWLFAADRVLLPRLYPWFHLTLRGGGWCWRWPWRPASRLGNRSPSRSRSRSPARRRPLGWRCAGLLGCAAVGLAACGAATRCCSWPTSARQLLATGAELVPLPAPAAPPGGAGGPASAERRRSAAARRARAAPTPTW